ncbi:MAG TPA: hypothetical protein VIM60_03410, partial [Edaphobacter sp.]
AATAAAPPINCLRVTTFIPPPLIISLCVEKKISESHPAMLFLRRRFHYLSNSKKSTSATASLVHSG